MAHIATEGKPLGRSTFEPRSPWWLQPRGGHEPERLAGNLQGVCVAIGWCILVDEYKSKDASMKVHCDLLLRVGDAALIRARMLSMLKARENGAEPAKSTHMDWCWRGIQTLPRYLCFSLVIESIPAQIHVKVMHH
jgi:hypothetical protein